MCNVTDGAQIPTSVPFGSFFQNPARNNPPLLKTMLTGPLEQEFIEAQTKPGRSKELGSKTYGVVQQGNQETPVLQLETAYTGGKKQREEYNTPPPLPQMN